MMFALVAAPTRLLLANCARFSRTSGTLRGLPSTFLRRALAACPFLGIPRSSKNLASTTSGVGRGCSGCACSVRNLSPSRSASLIALSSSIVASSNSRVSNGPKSNSPCVENRSVCSGGSALVASSMVLRTAAMRSGSAAGSSLLIRLASSAAPLISGSVSAAISSSARSSSCATLSTLRGDVSATWDSAVPASVAGSLTISNAGVGPLLGASGLSTGSGSKPKFNSLCSGIASGGPVVSS